MAWLSASEVAGYARAGGLTDPEAVATATAIAGWEGSPHPGESGGNTNAMGDVHLEDGTWGPSMGLWQVRSLRKDTGTGRSRDFRALSDPLFNARSMMEISKGGTDWGPWTIYRTGAYRKNLEAARQAAATGSVGPVGGQGTAALGGAVTSLTGALLSPSWWQRIGVGALGVALIVIGTGIVFRDSLGDVGRLAATVTPTGQLAKRIP